MSCPSPRNGHPCKSRRCPHCGSLWAGDVRRKLFANFGHYDGNVSIVTVTAPGEDILPWDTAMCTHGPDVRCTGKRGCRVKRDYAAFWNLRAWGKWAKLHRTAAQSTRRKLPHLDILGRVWEFQERGVLHVHVVVGQRTAANRRACDLYRQALENRASSYGFGYVGRKLESRPGERAAAYLASYFIDGHGSKASIRETVTHVDVPPHVVYVSTRLTTATGCTMRSMRRVRYLWVVARQVQTGELVVDMETGELVPAARAIRLRAGPSSQPVAVA